MCKMHIKTAPLLLATATADGANLKKLNNATYEVDSTLRLPCSASSLPAANVAPPAKKLEWWNNPFFFWKITQCVSGSRWTWQNASIEKTKNLAKIIELERLPRQHKVCQRCSLQKSTLQFQNLYEYEGGPQIVCGRFFPHRQCIHNVLSLANSG